MRAEALRLSGAATVSVVVGAAVVVAPQLSFLIAIGVACAAALAAPAGTWILAALVASLTFKGLVSLGLLPAVATFLDLPLVWGALFVALLKQRPRSPFLTRYLYWFAGLGLAVLLAWAFNPSEILRPVVFFMLIAEPFAVVAALMLDPPSARLRRALELTLLALLVLQIPLAAFQLSRFGPADAIQGTLYGAGAGAHVISAVIVVGVIWMLAGGIAREILGRWRFVLIAALAVIPFVADAKQVIIALPAIVLASNWRGGRLQPIVRTTLAVGSLVALFAVIPAGQATERFIGQSEEGKGGKQATARFVWKSLAADPASIVFGKGPAETVSRAAFLTTPSLQQSGFQRSPSPLAVLGLAPATIATEAQRTAIEVSDGGTSFNTGVSSTLGVIGDLGLFGALVYAGLLLTLFLGLRRETSPEGVAAAAGFAIFAVLGIVFDWWEQPPFGVFLGVLAGLALARSEESYSPGGDSGPRLHVQSAPAGSLSVTSASIVVKPRSDRPNEPDASAAGQSISGHHAQGAPAAIPSVSSAPEALTANSACPGLKIIIGAYACEPTQGSEPAVGWNWANEAARAGHDVWVITRRNNRKAIESAPTAPHASRLRFEYIDLPWPLRWLKRRSGHAGLLAYYYIWQVALAVSARRLHRRIHFDVAHHVTFVNDWLPSGLCVLPIPFVWGPVGGSTHQLPDTVELELPAYARRHEELRTSMQRTLRRFDPFVALTRSRADLILVYTQEALQGLSRAERGRARAIVHIGVSEDEPPHRAKMQPHPGGGDLRILTGGRLVHWKGQDLLIEGFARFVRSRPDIDAKLVVTGAGPYRTTLEALANRGGVADRVEFVGYLPRREDVFELMAESDLFALPTLRDGPPFALLEAMAYGLPVLCLDIGAPAELVPDNAGIKIAPTSRPNIVTEIADACAWIADHHDDAMRMGRAARAHALDRHHWDRIRDEIERAYAEVHSDSGASGPRRRTQAAPERSGSQ